MIDLQSNDCEEWQWLKMIFTVFYKYYAKNYPRNYPRNFLLFIIYRRIVHVILFLPNRSNTPK